MSSLTLFLAGRGYSAKMTIKSATIRMKRVSKLSSRHAPDYEPVYESVSGGAVDFDSQAEMHEQDNVSSNTEHIDGDKPLSVVAGVLKYAKEEREP
ncbi:hypothetical protein M408DRAFT_30975 [Serendipita vermifera MAFF 305830]|uniref:Uncharacterized protein n=1 Tax=Serendipita vermifera MAFF 305830 TaxID=933852 RepID=A0A0C2WQ27_SERVB|nr:hypothetical protein M408DRAFT_30975 [Serendipita vermifera MAFF 305830]